MSFALPLVHVLMSFFYFHPTLHADKPGKPETKTKMQLNMLSKGLSEGPNIPSFLAQGVACS